MDLGLMFFAADEGTAGGGTGGRDPYGLLLAAARFADQRGFSSVWTPERHFHEFGGAFANPTVTSAALATVTEKVELRAGSLVLPLHDPMRVAEDWAMIDNFSRGRAAISFGSGWNVDDFVWVPERYADRHRLLYEGIELIRRLWRGEVVERTNSFGKPFAVRLYPRPVRPELPVWLTASRSPETFVSAGRLGANVLTHLIGQDLEQLAAKIHLYREARAAAGHDPQSGKVGLMMHTFLGPDLEGVRARVHGPFRRYLASAVSLEQLAALGGGVISGGHRIEAHEIPPAVLEELLDLAFERYFHSASLMGTVAACRERLWSLAEIGVSEVACLIDFVADVEAVMASLELLDELRASLAAATAASTAAAALAAFAEELDA